ncbi:hypothetical protein TruAng_004977 [Truncatella angustata]|nr:hypothetical protein TruAng_004977 [Truncatella angustata]
MVRHNGLFSQFGSALRQSNHRRHVLFPETDREKSKKDTICLRQRSKNKIGQRGPNHPFYLSSYCSEHQCQASVHGRPCVNFKKRDAAACDDRLTPKVTPDFGDKNCKKHKKCDVDGCERYVKVTEDTDKSLKHYIQQKNALFCCDGDDADPPHECKSAGCTRDRFGHARSAYCAAHACKECFTTIACTEEGTAQRGGYCEKHERCAENGCAKLRFVNGEGNRETKCSERRNKTPKELVVALTETSQICVLVEHTGATMPGCSNGSRGKDYCADDVVDHGEYCKDHTCEARDCIEEAATRGKYKGRSRRHEDQSDSEEDSEDDWNDWPGLGFSGGGAYGGGRSRRGGGRRRQTAVGFPPAPFGLAW